MKRITITLTDEEYALLETQAQTQRRSVREMAGFLIARPQGFQIIQPVPIGPAPINPVWPPNVWCGQGNTADASKLPVMTWNATRINAARID